MTPPTPLRSFDELSIGQVFGFGAFRMTEEAILDFARRFDPQPFHLDAEAAKATVFGGLIASGLHTQAAAFGHILRTGWVEQVSLGGLGMTVRWPAPVRPGDEIEMTVRVEELVPSRGRADRGLVKLRYMGRRVADGVEVLDILASHLFKR
jgi:acyl dehydratase